MTATLPLWLILIGYASKAVLVLLALLSVWSVTVIIDRRRAFRAAMPAGESPDAEFNQAKTMIRKQDGAELREWADRSPSLLARSTRELITAPQDAESISYALRGFLTEERARLGRGLPILASLGSNAPFIGLFGTVLGIIQSFGALATSQSAMNSVIFSLAEALVATAVGLFVALPASLAYNFFLNRLRGLVGECEGLRDLYLSRPGMDSTGRGA